jgi:hypothetical protein
MSRRKHRSRPVEAVKRPEAAEARRLRAAGLLAQGRSQAEVAEAVGVSRESVRRYAAAGLAAGRPSCRTPRPPRSSRRCARAPRPTGSPATCGPWSGSPRWSNASRGCAWRGRRPGGCWSGGSAGACSGLNARPGHGLIDRELYLPEGWTDDRPRCRQAGIGDRVEFHTKPQLARRMLERALDAGVPTAWVTADEVYGGDGRLRRWLEERDLAHVLAVNRNQSLVSGLFRFERADQLAARIPAGAWRHLSAGQGAKGERRYAWARVAIRPLREPGRGHWLLVRRSLADGALADYGCYGPAATSLAELVQVAGLRWTVECGFQQGKGETGLDHYQVRRYQAWYRHVTLSMLAQAFLAVQRARAAVGAGGR